MPYARCPVCQSVFHLAVRGTPEAWERQHVRERAQDGTPLLKCLGCSVDLRPGHRVAVRTLPPHLAAFLSIGDLGVVESQVAAGRTSVAVRFGQLRAELKREELSYVPGHPSAA